MNMVSHISNIIGLARTSDFTAKSVANYLINSVANYLIYYVAN